ncbi:MAG: hypothetical protein EPO07_02800 [Verrucomicrobia bacterium]|nr:MAG: hypothetical protein EPO07_02800 [Verrucomicrobiota bacterium]
MKILLVGLAACVPLALYYAMTLRHGARAAQVWHVDTKFLAYVVYELTGMGGIGLSYAELREIARSPQLASELSHHLPQLILPVAQSGLLLAVIFLGLRRRAKTAEQPLLSGISFVLLFTAGVFAAGSFLLQKAFWARHYAPVFPIYVTLLGLAIAGVWQNLRPWLRLLPSLVCVLLVWSALNIRFAPSLRKEDYRSAAQFTKSAIAEGKTVWWMAGGYPAAYYRTYVRPDKLEAGSAYQAFCAPDVSVLPLPDYIVMNRTDLVDPVGTVQKLIAENHYTVAARYQAFTIWTR